MPKLKRLNVKELLSILRELGFEVISRRGSHIRLERVVGGEKQRITVAGHGSKSIPVGTLKNIYRTLRQYVSEDILQSYFYTD